MTAAMDASARNVECVREGERCAVHQGHFPAAAKTCWGARPARKRPEAAALETIVGLHAASDPDALACEGSNHVPGCGHFNYDAPAPAAVPPVAGATLAEIPLELVDIGHNVRVDVTELEELAASIAEHGVLQPVKVTGPHPDGRYLVLWGQRRTRASQMAGLATIPAIVLPPTADVDHDGVLRPVEQLVENLHRADLNPIDRARAMRAVVDGGVSQADLARKLGIAPSTVSNDLRLLTLDEPVVEKIRAGEVSASHGKAMASLPERHQRELASRIVEGKLSAHQIESELAWRRQTAEADAKALERATTAAPKLLAALEAAGVAKGAQVSLFASYNMHRETVQAALEAAGYRSPERYVDDRPARGKCDCAAVRVEFNRLWKITPGCVNDRHRDRQRNLDNQAEQERRKAIALRVAELRARVRAQLEHVDVALLILAHGDTWALPQLVEKARPDDPAYVAELRDLVADAMAKRADASSVWNDRRKPMEKALEDLIAMLPEATS